MINITILLVFGSIFLLGLAETYRATAYPLIAQLFDIDKKLSSLIFSLTSFSSVLTPLSSLWWQEKLNPKKTNILAYLFFSLAYFTLYLSLYLKTFYISLISSTLLGIGMGVIGINANTSISRYIPKKKQQKYFSILHSLYGIASLIAPFIFNALYPKVWEEGLIGIAAIASVPILFSIFEKSRPPTEREDTHEEIENGKKRWQFFYVMAVSLYVVSELLLSSRLTSYLIEDKNFEVEKASTYLSYFFLSLMTGRILLIFYKVKAKSEIFALSSCIISLIVFLLGLYVHPIFLAITGFTMSGVFPLLMTAAPTFFGKDSSRVISRAVILYGFSLFVMHFIFGNLADIFGVGGAFLMGPLALVIAILMLLLLIISHKNSIEHMK